VNQSRWITRAEACLELRMSSRTLRRMVACEELPAPKRIGNHRQLYFNRVEFERAVARLRR
jgi:excisionase family DNA binding protein